MPKPIVDEAVKKAHAKDDLSGKNLDDLMQCIDDPLFFMKNFMKVQDALKGNIPFDPYPFQEKIIRAFQNNNKVILNTGRQLGKCLSFNINVLADGLKVKIGSLIPQNTIKIRIVTFLENLLIKIS